MKYFGLIIFKIYLIILEIDSFKVIQPSRINKNSKSKECSFGYCGSTEECGKIFYGDSKTKIIGGNESIPHRWPFVVFLKISYKILYYDGFFIKSYGRIRQRTYQCGGVLIDEYTILTAAHCVENFKAYQYNTNLLEVLDVVNVYLGVHDTANTNTDYQLANKIIIHEKYDKINALNDIALLKLSSKAILNQKVQIACLPTRDFKMNESTELYAVGWGVTSEFSGVVSKVLMETNLNYYNSTACDETAPEAIKNWDSQICAGDLNGFKNVCYGDSGGPLLAKQTNNGTTRFFVVGLTSYGDNDGCAVPNKAGIFTRVTFYLNWIKNHAT